MKLCFLNGLSGISAIMLEAVINEYAANQGIDTFVVSERQSDHGPSPVILLKIKARYPKVRVYQVTHVPAGKVREGLSAAADGYWYPWELEKYPARIARRLAGCLMIDQAAIMIDGGSGKTGLPRLLSAYGEIKRNLGMLRMIRLPGEKR